MKKMVYIIISVSGLLVVGILFAGCFYENKNPEASFSGLSFTQNHMDFSYCYSFYLRAEDDRVLFDADVRFDEKPFSIILESCEVDSDYLNTLESLLNENGISDYVKNYTEKPSFFQVLNATANKTTMYFSDDTSKTATTKSEYEELLYDFFVELAQTYADKSVYIEK